MNKAGSETANENNKVLIPFADFTKRRTLPTRKTRTTRSSVGDTKNSCMYLANATPEIDENIKKQWMVVEY